MTPSLFSMTLSPLFPFLDSEEAVLPGGLEPNCYSVVTLISLSGV